MNLQKTVERKTVGSKGEILPSRRFREALELKPGTMIEMEVQGRSLVVKPIRDPLEELDQVLETELSIKKLKKIAESQVRKEAAAQTALRTR